MNKRQKKKKISQMGARFIELSKIYEELIALKVISIDGPSCSRSNTRCLIQPYNLVKLPFFDRDKTTVVERRDCHTFPFSATINFANIEFEAILSSAEVQKYFPEHVKKEAEYIEIDGVRYSKEV